MAIEDKNDKQIKDLLENDFPMKAIVVDFRDLNNKTLIIKSSFVGAYEQLEAFDGTWAYLAVLNNVSNTIDLVGITNLLVTLDGWLKINWLETNKVFKKKGWTKRMIDYLQKFAELRHYHGIRIEIPNDENSAYNISLFEKNAFVNKGDGKMEWLNS